MKKKSKKDTGILAFTALYAIMMIFVLAATVFVLSHEKLKSTEIIKYVVETEYVYITEAPSETEVEESAEDTVQVVESVFETLLIKEYMGKIGIFNADGETVYIIDVYTKTLPEADRRLLEEGFEITNEKQLASIIQDYSS